MMRSIHDNMWTFICILCFILRAIFEVFCSVITAFRSQEEALQVTFVDTNANQHILAHTPSLKSFRALWFGSRPFAQTALSRYVQEEPKKEYNREMVELSDGVQVALDWKADPYAPADAPLIFICHGVGGDSSSNYLKTFTSYASNLGFRTVAYNRRGHGGTSLLPRGFDQLQRSTLDPESGDLKGADQRTRCQLFPRHYDPRDMEEVVKHFRTR